MWVMTLTQRTLLINIPDFLYLRLLYIMIMVCRARSSLSALSRFTSAVLHSMLDVVQGTRADPCAILTTEDPSGMPQKLCLTRPATLPSAFPDPSTYPIILMDHDIISFVL